MKKLSLPAFLVNAVLVMSVHSQTTSGKDFWLGFMENYAPPRKTPALTIYLSAVAATTGTISIPGQHWEQRFTVQPGRGTSISIPTDLAMAVGSEKIESRGIHIETSDTIACFALNYVSRSADATVILPTKALAREYTVMSYGSSNYPSECMIVGTMDSTVVEITPTATTIAGNKPDIPFTIVLARGDAYQVQSNGDLTGTRILSRKPVAVLGGSVCASVPVNTDFSDHLFEQMYPLTSWGLHFV